MCCVSSSQICILWNVDRLPTFKLGRGLRQGDSISPYLFVLVMERLSIRIHQLVDSGAWNPIQVAHGGPPISHLFFADVVMLFCKAKITQVELVADVLRSFCESSGLKINIAKSKAITSKGVRPEVRDQIQSIAPISFVRDLGST